MKLLISCGFIFCAVFCVVETVSEEIEVDQNKNDEVFGDNKQFSGVIINRTLEANYPNLHLILVNPQNQSQTAAFTLQNLTSIHSNSWYNPIRNTVIYSFGFAEKVSSPTTQLILDAYVKRGGHNIIVIDWSAYNGVTIPDYYPAAIEEMKVIGRLVGTRIASAFNSYMILKFHLVGYSLGAHLVANLNRGIKNSFLTPRIPKIIALDPAGPYMYNASYNNDPLNSSDALIVQVIHTDTFLIGAPVKCGNIDFYPNGGELQPGCPLFDSTNQLALSNFCSHQMSVYFYAESVATKGTNVFSASRCSNYADFLSGKCRTKSQQMGFSARDFVTGDFYLQTNGASPFSRENLCSISFNSTA